MNKKINIVDEAKHLIEIIESANGEPQVIRDMILEGDAIDKIAFILDKPPAVTTWKDVDKVIEALDDEREAGVANDLFDAVHGTDTPTTPEE